MKDYMYLALATDDGMRSYAAATTHLVEEARQRHGTSPTATVALGRALTAAALMSGLLKVGPVSYTHLWLDKRHSIAVTYRL